MDVMSMKIIRWGMMMSKYKKCGYYSDGECSICGMGMSGEDTFCRLCKDNSNCYYKQLIKLKEENIKLNAIIDSYQPRLQALKDENERLKEENYQLQKDCQICENFIDFIPCKPIRDMDYDLQKVISQRDNYYQTLQEIKEIAERCNLCEECSGLDDCERECGDNVEPCSTYQMQIIVNKITKAEEE